MNIQEQIETLEANGQLDTADTMEKMLAEVTRLKFIVDQMRDCDRIYAEIEWERVLEEQTHE